MKNKLGILIIILVNVSQLNAAKSVEPRYSFIAADASIEKLAMSPNEEFIVAGTANSSGGKSFFGITVWDRSEWNNKDLNLDKFNKHKIKDIDLSPSSQTTTSLAVLNDNETIVGSDSTQIFKYNKTNKAFIDFINKDTQRFIRPGTIINARIPANQDIIAVGMKETYPDNISAKIFNLNSGNLITQITANFKVNRPLAISPDGQLLGTVWESSKEAILWNAINGKEIKKIQTNNKNSIYSMDISKNYIAIGYLGGIVVYKRDTYESIFNVPHEFNHPELGKLEKLVSKVTITPDEQCIVFKDSNGKLGFITISTGKKIKLKPFEKVIDTSTFALSHTGKYIMIGSRDGQVKVYEVNDIINGKSVVTPALDLNSARNLISGLTSTLTSLALK